MSRYIEYACAECTAERTPFHHLWVHSDEYTFGPPRIRWNELRRDDQWTSRNESPRPSVGLWTPIEAYACRCSAWFYRSERYILSPLARPPQHLSNFDISYEWMVVHITSDLDWYPLTMFSTITRPIPRARRSDFALFGWFFCVSVL